MIVAAHRGKIVPPREPLTRLAAARTHPLDSTSMKAVPRTRTYEFLICLAVASAYVAAGMFGLSVASVNKSASAVWPATGIALAALLVLGYRVWPAIFLGAFVVNIVTAGTVATSLGISLGNTLEGVLGCYLVRRFAGGT